MVRRVARLELALPDWLANCPSIAHRSTTISPGGNGTVLFCGLYLAGEPAEIAERHQDWQRASPPAPQVFGRAGLTRDIDEGSQQLGGSPGHEVLPPCALSNDLLAQPVACMSGRGRQQVLAVTRLAATAVAARSGDAPPMYSPRAAGVQSAFTAPPL